MPPRASAKPKYRVFVSHATADKWIATIFCKAMETAGAATFRDDRDIAGGDDIPETIRNEIGRANELLVLYTPKSHNRPWVLLEIGMALARPKTSITVVRQYMEVENIPDILKSKKSHDLNDFERYLSELKERVRKWQG